jgi:sortase A
MRTLPGKVTFLTILTCLAFYTVAKADQKVASAAAGIAFEQALDEVLRRQPDRTLWSAKRRAAYDQALPIGSSAPTALLRISAIDLLVPVFDGTSETVLNWGIGWIETTAAPGSDGNVGLAGHREGFFRRLEDLEVGDMLELQTVGASVRYRVASISIVEPSDVHVLDQSDEPSVTLVTCYPFYFVGSAPQRYIVRGVRDGWVGQP